MGSKRSTADFLEKNQFDSLHRDIDEIISILTVICKTAGAGK